MDQCLSLYRAFSSRFGSLLPRLLRACPNSSGELFALLAANGLANSPALCRRATCQAPRTGQLVCLESCRFHIVARPLQRMLADADQRREVAGRQSTPAPGVQEQQALGTGQRSRVPRFYELTRASRAPPRGLGFWRCGCRGVHLFGLLIVSCARCNRARRTRRRDRKRHDILPSTRPFAANYGEELPPYIKS